MNETKQAGHDAVAGPVEPTVRQRADGGAAFPVLPPQDTAAGIATGYPYPESGMTLRDYFAAKAIAAVLADPCFREKADTMGYGEFANEAAEEAYVVADAMLQVRAA